MHKRLMDPVLSAMEGERSAYFAGITEELDADERLAGISNMIFLFLAAAAPFAPIQLPKRDFIGRLLAFHDRNQHRIFRTAFDPSFLTDKDLIRPVVNEFVQEISLIVLKKLDEGDLEVEGEQKTYRLSYPIDPEAFPFEDLDEQDDEDD